MIAIALAHPGYILDRIASGTRAKDQNLAQRVRAQSVGAVDTDAGGLARGVETLERCSALDIGVDAAHHVVLHWADANRFLDRIEIFVLEAEFAHHRQTRFDLVFSQM